MAKTQAKTMAFILTMISREDSSMIYFQLKDYNDRKRMILNLSAFTHTGAEGDLTDIQRYAN